MRGKLALGVFGLFCFAVIAQAQVSRAGAQPATAPYVSDNGDGTYKNPILNADYSDPDAIRVGNDFYLTASSFDAIPGLPILHSRDLVNWTIIGHALLRQPPYDHFSAAQHGNGVWAPEMRYHNGEYYIYYPDPDYGIYLVKAKDPAGPWTAPILVEAGKGLIDPCPLWDDNTPPTPPSKVRSSTNATASITSSPPPAEYRRAGSSHCAAKTSMDHTNEK